MTPPLRLTGDIGGTNARFALARDGVYTQMTSFVGDEFPSLEAAIDFYLARLPAGERPSEAALAIAGPVGNDGITLTNHPWSFTKSGLKAHFGFDRLIVLNDFTANAVSVPYLTAGDLDQIGQGQAKPNAPVAVLGPGTGLGVSGLLYDTDGKFIAIEGEGGHVTMAPANQREADMIDILRGRFDHVSAERILSGIGLVNLYEALCALDGVPAVAYQPAQITDRATGETDLRCREVVEMFCAMLGTVAGNLAVTLGAQGGVYIAGGIVPRLGDRFRQSGFRQRFEAKGRFRAYMEAIPTYLIVHPDPAMVGLSRLP
jgi:glucokinase